MTRRGLLVVVLLAVPWPVAALMLPALTGGVGSVAAFTGANVLQCATYVSPVTMTATKLSGWVFGGASGTMGFGLYRDSDGALLASATSATAAGAATATGLSVPLVAGTRYRVCVCDTATAATYYATYFTSGGGTGKLTQMLNAGAFPTTVGTAANACTTGTPPATTGAITANLTYKPPLLLLE